MTDRCAELRTQLTQVKRDLREHMASWDYAFANGMCKNGASEHPRFWAVHHRTERLHRRIKELQAQIAEFQDAS